MQKDFLAWAHHKEKLENAERKIICKHRQVWLAAIGVNIGKKTSKAYPFLRPVVILNPYFSNLKKRLQHY